MMQLLDGFNIYMFKELDRDTFKFLRNEQCVLENFHNLAVMAGSQYDKIQNDNLLGRSDINFNSDIDLKWKGSNLRLHIGCKIDKHALSYFLMICKTLEGKCHEIIRKFHYDFDINCHQQKHPNFHFQYAGEQPPFLQHNADDYNMILNPWLSEPRLFAPPISLALLINMILKEFDTQYTATLRENDRWRSIVKKNESVLLGKFFDNCSEFLSDKGHSFRRLLLTDYCYGK